MDEKINALVPMKKVRGSVIDVLFNTKMASQLKQRKDVKIRISVSISSLDIRLLIVFTVYVKSVAFIVN